MSVLDATMEGFEVDGDQGRLEFGNDPGLLALGCIGWSCSVMKRCCLQVASVH